MYLRVKDPEVTVTRDNESKDLMSVWDGGSGFGSLVEKNGSQPGHDMGLGSPS